MVTLISNMSYYLSRLIYVLIYSLTFLTGSQQALSDLPVYFIKSAAWNLHCNSSTFARLSGADASVSLSPSHPTSVEHRLYGSCLISMANADRSAPLHITFTSYPALHDCVGATLTIYEKLASEHQTLWSGSCGDALHTWQERVLRSRSSEIWIWFHKWKEWPSILHYSMMDFKMRISTKPYPDKCDDSLCSYHGKCTRRKADPPQNLDTFDTTRQLHQCHCVQPYTGPSCQYVKSDAINFNSCQPEPCHNSGRCVRNSTHHSGFFCDCSEPYNGDLCQYNSAVCLDNTEICGEHGICAIKDRRVICQCNLHWIGQWCDISTACARLTPCQHDGICNSVSVNMYTCDCLPPWGGANCTDYNAHSVPTAEYNTTHNATLYTQLDVDEQAANNPGVRFTPSAVVFLTILTIVLMFFISVGLYSVAQKYCNHRKRYASGARSAVAMKPGRRRWRELSKLIPSSKSLHKFSPRRFVKALQPRLMKSTAEPPPVEVVEETTVDYTEESPVVDEFDIDLRIVAMDEILDTVNKYDSSSKTTGKSTRSTADDTKAQIDSTNYETPDEIPAAAADDKRFASLMPYNTTLQNTSKQNLSKDGLPLQQRKDIKLHRKRMANLLQKTNQ